MVVTQMTIARRRWLVLAGSSLAGAAFGVLVNALLDDVGRFIGTNNILMNPKGVTTVWLGGNMTIWLACFAIGAGIGVAIAATIRDERQ
jgi:hypothetical protein